MYESIQSSMEAVFSTTPSSIMRRTKRHARTQHEPRYIPGAVSRNESSHETEFPTNSNISAAGNATVANAAGKICVDRQSFDFTQAANEVQIAAKDDHSNQVTTTNYFNHNYGYNPIIRTWPNNDAVSFLQNRTNMIGSNHPYVFSDRMFRTLTECKETQEDNAKHFQEILPRVEKLEAVIILFQEKLLKTQRRKKENRSSTHPSWTKQRFEIPQKISEARKYYKYENRNLSDKGRLIRRIKEASPTFLDWLEWLDWLPNERSRSSIGGSIECLMTAVADGHDVYTIHLKYLAETLEMFGDSKDYIYLQKRRLLSTNMMNDTMAIFAELADVAIILLQSTLSRKRERQARDTLDDGLVRLRNYLREINRDSFNERQGRFVTPHIKESDPYDLQIANRFLRLFSGIASKASLDAPRNELMTGEGVAVEKYPKTSRKPSQVLDDSDNGPSICMIFRELSFKDKENAADIEECLAGEEMNHKQRRQISSITREEAFQDWLGKETGSSTLIIYGNMEIDTCISPASFLTAKIGDQYYRKSGFIVLSYFCGLHGDRDPSDIMRTIIGQLLSQAEPVVGSCLSIQRNEFKGIKRRNLEALKRVFADLIEQLYSHRIIIFCLIDAISTFETSAKTKDTKSVLSSLCRVARSLHPSKRGRSRSEMIMKILISDGQTSDIAHEYVKPNEVLEITEGAEEASDDESAIASEDIDDISSLSCDEDDY